MSSVASSDRHVSIRAPAQGATNAASDRAAHEVSIRAPAQGATSMGLASMRPERVSIRAPAGGDRPDVQTSNDAVSIRAPAQGATEPWGPIAA